MEGDASAAEKLLPQVYLELRRLAAARLANEDPGQTLQPTALVHEAYLRLVDGNDEQSWNGRGHFFGAAAQAMRRILVENARRRRRLKHGGGIQRQDLDSRLAAPDKDETLMRLDEALELLAADDPEAAQLVQLLYFAGLTVKQAAELLGVSPRKVNSMWAIARAWLQREIGDA